MPRQTTGRPRGPATRTPAQHKPNARRQKKRAQNALAIAEHEVEEKAGFRRSRYGQLEPGNRKRVRDEGEDEESDEDGRHKRAKADLRERYGKDAELDSDSEGNEWVTGQVDDEDDDSLDSDEAFGESDEERFAGFTFRGSSMQKDRKKIRKAPKQGGFLDEDEDEDGDEGDEELDSGEESDNFKENAVDLATMLDDNFDEEDSEDDSKVVKTKKRSSKQQSVSESEDDDEDADDESESDTNRHSDFSMSDEDEEETHHRTNLLKDLVAGFDTGDISREREDKARIRAQEAMNPSTAPAGSAADLLAELDDPSLRALQGPTIKSSKKSARGIPAAVEAPLPQRQQGRLDRAAAAEKTKDELNKWTDTVKQNRRAEHLVFPLHNPDETSAKNAGRLQPLTGSKPFNELEAMIQDIQFKTGMAPTAEKPDDDDEDNDGLQLEGVPEKQLTLAEVKARNAELRRAREVLFREEHKAKRIKKIKSKSYRRVHRKERERDLQKQQQADAEAGILPEEDDQDRLDRLRAEERMGAKHRESKWAKAMKATGRANWDEDARGGVIEMARREEELKRRILGRGVDGDGSAEEDSEFDSQSDDENASDRLRSQLSQIDHAQNPGKASKLSSMKFMQKAEAANKERNDAEIARLRRELDGLDTEEESDSAEKPRRSFGPRQDLNIPLSAPKEQRGEFEERDDSDDSQAKPQQHDDESDVEVVTSSVSRDLKKQGRGRGPLSQEQAKQPNATQDVPDMSNPWTTIPKRNSKKKATTSAADDEFVNPNNAEPDLPQPKQQLATTNPPAKAASKSVRLLSGHDDDDSSSSGDSSDDEPELSTQRGMIKQAFAGDSVVATFDSEKLAAARSERTPSPAADILPGWGSWAGTGLNKKDRRERKRHDERLQKAAKDNFAASKGGKRGKVDQTRKDANLKGVIISERRLPKTAKYLASALPHTFETKAQYERSLRLPMGPEWVTKETHQAGTKPRVLLGGGIIRPMEKPAV